MAYLESPLARSGLARIGGLIASARRMLRRRKIYRETVAELNALSTRELADLGIPRSMITRIALEAARNAD
jgi:uncharacterized protein YjiS (DUF1127 family)